MKKIKEFLVTKILNTFFGGKGGISRTQIINVLQMILPFVATKWPPLAQAIGIFIPILNDPQTLEAAGHLTALFGGAQFILRRVTSDPLYQGSLLNPKSWLMRHEPVAPAVQPITAGDLVNKK